MRAQSSLTRLEKSGSKQLLAMLNIDKCSCARQESKITQGLKHGPKCELRHFHSSVLTRDKSKQELGKVYRQTSEETSGRYLGSLIPNLNDRQTLKFDMDVMTGDLDAGVNVFIAKCHQIKTIITYSSLLKYEEVNELMSSTRPEDVNMVHSSVVSFYDHLAKFYAKHPTPPASSHVRYNPLQSVDCYYNEKLLKAIAMNL